MESTEDSGIMQNAIDANIQGNEFANDLYGKLDAEISFEDALKNNNSNADQEMPFLEVNADNFELNNLNGSAAYTNSEAAKPIEKMDVQEGAEAPEKVPEGEEGASVSNVMETENLVDEILGESTQTLDESVEAEAEQRLLAESEEEITLHLSQDSLQQNDSTVEAEEVEAESSATEFSKEATQEESKSEQEAAQVVEEEVEAAANFIEELPQNEENPSENVEEFQGVVEEPSSENSSVKRDVEVEEIQTVSIEEVSADGSVVSNSNPPIITFEADVNEEQEKTEEMQQEIVQTEENVELTESVVVEEAEKSTDEATTVVEEVVEELKLEDVSTTSNTNEDTALENKIGDEMSELEKQIEEAPIVINEETIETEKPEETAIILDEDGEEIQESIVIIEETEIIEDDCGGEGTKLRKVETKSRNSEELKQKQKKPVALEKMKIPHHVLGTNIEKPVRDLCSNGRVPPKPRLGVKIPYRNLTSQIVSKQEIEQVILDRARAKQQQPPPGGDLFFTKKLTQRLARKIIPEEKKKAAEMEEQRKKELEEQKKKNTELEAAKTKSEEENADLLAILEGDADDLTDVSGGGGGGGGKSNEELDLKEWEREVALKQLEEMPQRRRGRSAGLEASTVKKSSVSTYKKATDTSKNALPSEAGKPSAIPVARKASTEEKSKEHTDAATEEDIPPRFSTNSVVKTYTRKRKPTDSIGSLAKSVDVDTSAKKPFKTGGEHKEQKVSIDLPPNAYVTKSSRVIKRKVIWDPDEAASPIRSYKATKTDVAPKQENVVSPPKAVEKKPAKSLQKTSEEKAKTPQKAAEEKQKVVVAAAAEKAPLKKATLLRKPKRLTEVDKLLMDEGAVNMIYDVKATEDQGQVKHKKRNLSTISLDKAQRDLLNKTNEIKNDLQISSTRASPKSLRKKDGTSGTPPQQIKTQPGQISRKKSKDSNRSSVHSPPASPAYNFAQHPEASRIIRRHSSSSFSSGDEANPAPQRDSESESANPAKVAKKKRSSLEQQKTVKKAAKVEKETANNSVEKGRLNAAELSESFSELVGEKEGKVEKYGEFKTLCVKAVEKMVHVAMNVGRKDALLNVQVLNELTVVLNQVANDAACSALLLTSTHKSFCQGLDYKLLVVDSEEQRKKKATTVANAVKEFLQTLVVFPKFIAAAVDGSAVGLGVTMLPLFDMVLSSDKAVYSAPYSRLGCAAEGGCLLSLPHVAGCGLPSELLYAAQKIEAGDAALRGFVTRIVWAEKFQEDVLSTVLDISNQSQQGLEAVKKQLRQPWIESIQSSLAAEVDMLVQHWMSAECQKNFAKYRLDKE